MPTHSKDNVLLGRSNDGASGFEGIAYNDREGRFYILIEALPYEDGSYKAKIEAYNHEFNYLKSHWLHFGFERENKGFEGLAYLHRAGHDYLLALCEDNHCQGGKKGRQPGGGRIQVFQQEKDWEYVDTIKIPEAVKFEDYAGLALNGNRLAIVSQASSELWFGTLEDTGWDFIDLGDEAIRQTICKFPSRDKDVYCNIEGVSWISPTQIVVVSDRAKPDQPDRCRVKDESIHIFNILEA